MAEMNEPGAPPAKPVTPIPAPTPASTPPADAVRPRPVPVASSLAPPASAPPSGSAPKPAVFETKPPARPLPPSLPPAAAERGGGQSLALAGCVILFILGGAGFVWLWSEHDAAARRIAEVERVQQSADPAKMTVLEDQVRSLRARLTELEQRPAPKPPAPPPPAPKIDLQPLQDRIAALEQKPAPPAPDTELASQLQAIAAQTATLGKQLAQAQSQASAAAEQASRSQGLQSAAAALAAGKPLGKLDGASPALARYAAEPPPTEAGLRLSFAEAARAAQAASHPDVADRGFAARMWVRAQSLVTVKQGDKVLVGSPAAATLAEAQQRLAAGDLAGALSVLDGLDPAATQAMAAWRAQAQGLLDARAALATAMAGQAHG